MVTKTWMLASFGVLGLLGCFSSQTIKYGFLPGSDYQFFPPTRHVDLNGKHFNFVFFDKRSDKSNLKCSDIMPDTDSELEGALGYRYFTSYFKAMADSCRGKIDSTGHDTVYVDLQLLGPRMSGFISVTVHGIVQFAVRSRDSVRVYCSDMEDGDPDSPYGTFSFATRKSAMRGMIGASCRRALQQYFEDVAGSVHQ